MNIKVLYILLNLILLIPVYSSYANPLVSKLGKTVFKVAKRSKAIYEIYDLAKGLIGDNQDDPILLQLRKSIHFFDQALINKDNPNKKYLEKANNILDTLWVTKGLNEEQVTAISFFKGVIHKHLNENEIAYSWWFKTIKAPFLRSFLGSTKATPSIISYKEKATLAMCQFLPENDDYVHFFCGLNYLFKYYATEENINLLHNCAKDYDKDSCGVMGRMIIAGLTDQKGKDYLRTVRKKDDSDYLIKVASHYFLPRFEKPYEELAKSNVSVVNSFFWQGIAAEALGNYKAAASIYRDLCDQKLRKENSHDTIIYDACQIIHNPKISNYYPVREYVSLSLESCLNKFVTMGCSRLFDSSYGSEQIEKYKKIIKSHMSYRHILNRQTQAYDIYSRLSGYEANQYLTPIQFEISKTDHNGGDWDLVGNPDILIRIETGTDLLIYESKNNKLIENRNSYSILPNVLSEKLPLKKIDLQQIKVTLFDEDSGSNTLIGIIEFNADKNGVYKLRSNKIYSAKLGLETFKKGSHPLDLYLAKNVNTLLKLKSNKKLMDALKRRASSSE